MKWILENPIFHCWGQPILSFFKSGWWNSNAQIIQENYQPFYPSEPFRITRFQMRHPVAFVFAGWDELVISNRIFFGKPTKYIRSQAFQLLKTVQIIIYSLLPSRLPPGEIKRPPMTNTQLILINKNSLMPLIENYVKNEY